MDIGDVITVEVESPTIKAGETAIYRYTGVLLPSEPHDDANTIRITGDHPNVSVRIIPKRWIRSIDGTAFKFTAKPMPRTYVVSGSKNAVYTVIIDPDGNHSCTCAAFQFRGGNCKHIQQKLAEG